MFDVHDAIAARLNSHVGLCSRLPGGGAPVRSPIETKDYGPRLSSVKVESMYEKQARLEMNYTKPEKNFDIETFKLKSKYIDVEPIKLFEPRNNLTTRFHRCTQDFDDDFSAPKHSKFIDDFYTPTLKHDPELISPIKLRSRFDTYE